MRTHDEFRSQATILLIYSLSWRQGGAAFKFWLRSFIDSLFVFCSVFFFFLLFFCSFSFRSCRVNCFGKLFYKASKLQKVCFQKNMFWKLLFCVSSCALSFPLRPVIFSNQYFLALTNDQCGKIMLRKITVSCAP